MIIAIEGIDGAGKTTVAKILQEMLPQAAYIRTPGARLPHVRDLVLGPEHDLDNTARMFFFLGEMIDISNHFLTHPYIILDRFYLSTYVYQVMMRKDVLSKEQIDNITALFHCFLPKVHRTFILNVDIKTARSRANGHDKDVFEMAGDKVWHMRKSYYDEAETLAIAPLLGQITYINTVIQSADQVAHTIYDMVTK